MLVSVTESRSLALTYKQGKAYTTQGVEPVKYVFLVWPFILGVSDDNIISLLWAPYVTPTENTR